MNAKGRLVLALLALALGAWPSLVTGAQLFAFPAMDGWTLAGQPQVFSPDTLYDYINGGSDLYLKYEFEELTVVEYRKGTMSVSAEVYRHRTPDHAFGIYSQERVPSAEFLAIGAQGYYENAVCNFIQRGYYVKLSGENTGADDREILLGFARRISGRRHEAEGETFSITSQDFIISRFPSRHRQKFLRLRQVSDRGSRQRQISP